jgi:hypothetical protein
MQIKKREKMNNRNPASCPSGYGFALLRAYAPAQIFMGMDSGVINSNKPVQLMSHTPQVEEHR